MEIIGKSDRDFIVRISMLEMAYVTGNRFTSGLTEVTNLRDGKEGTVRVDNLEPGMGLKIENPFLHAFELVDSAGDMLKQLSNLKAAATRMQNAFPK